MLIGNRLNPNSVINTDLVTDYWKGQRQDHAKPFTITFGFAAGTSKDAICAVWEFEQEEERTRERVLLSEERRKWQVENGGKACEETRSEV